MKRLGAALLLLGLVLGLTGLAEAFHGGSGGATPGGSSGNLQTNDGAGGFGAYAGTSCTNQFPRSLNASGAATCAAVANADLAGSIAASKLIGTDIAVVGTLTGGATGAGFTVALGTSTITGILGSANGGTANGFTKFTGPTTAEKTFTLPNASATILTSAAAVTAAQGGTGIDTSASSGLPYVAAGVWSVSTTQLPQVSGLGIGVAGVANKLMIPSGGVIDFNAGDVTLTHSLNTLTLAGGTLTGSGTSPEFQGTNTTFGGVSHAVGNRTNSGIGAYGAGGSGDIVTIVSAGTVVSAMNAGYWYMSSAGGMSWSSSNVGGGTIDLYLNRDAAGVLAQRNGANAQAFRVYGTFTNASNYERATLSTTAGSGITLAAETAGTGAANLNITLTPAGTGNVLLAGANAQATNLKQTTTTVTCNSGTGTCTASNLIPAGATVVSITARVTTILAGVGLTTWSLGDGTTTDLWATGKALAAGTTVAATDHKSTWNIKFYAAANNVVLTAAAGQFDSGVVRLTVHYIDSTAPTS